MPDRCPVHGPVDSALERCYDKQSYWKTSSRSSGAITDVQRHGMALQGKAWPALAGDAARPRGLGVTFGSFIRGKDREKGLTMSLRNYLERSKDQRARNAAKRAGLIARKSRRAVDGWDNEGGFQVLEPSRNYVVAGSRFDLTADDVIAMCA
jgi:hypothetical protein